MDCAWQYAGPPKLGHGTGDGFDQDTEQAKLNCRFITSAHICYTTFLDVGFGFWDILPMERLIRAGMLLCSTTATVLTYFLSLGKLKWSLKHQALENIHVISLPQDKDPLSQINWQLMHSLSLKACCEIQYQLYHTDPSPFVSCSSVSTSDQISHANGCHLKVAFNVESAKEKAIILRNTIVLI